MKKLLVILVVVTLCLSFTGCSVEDLSRSTWEGTGFTLIECKGGMDYVYHNETKVIYVFIQDNYQAGMTALLNPDGTPMLLED